MPIAVTCPGCSARMKAPDAAAGKKVKCPKCQGAITVPGSAQFEVVDEPSAPAKHPGFGGGPKPAIEAAPEVLEEEKPRPKTRAEDDDEGEKPRKKSKAAVEEDDENEKPRKRRRDEDDERDEDDKPRKKRRDEDDEDDKPRKKTRDQDDEDDRPTKKKKKKRSADDEGGGTNLVRNIIGGVLLVILLGVAGYVFYDKFGRKENEGDKESNTNTIPPSGPPVRPGGAPGGSPPVVGRTPDALGPRGVPASWVEFHSDKDKFKIMMPQQATEKPNAKNREYNSKDSPGVWMVGVIVLDVEGGAAVAESELLKAAQDGAVQKLKQNPRYKNVQEKEITYLGQTSREISVDLGIGPPGSPNPQETIMFFRNAIFNRKVYTVMIAGPASQRSIINSGFDTFQVVK
jgi:hypothetical protein